LRCLVLIDLVRWVLIFIADLVSTITLIHLHVLHANHVGCLRHASHNAVASIEVVHVLRLVESIDLAHKILELAIGWLTEIVWAALKHVWLLLLVLHLTHCLI
jgi:hypothetical protein